MVKLPGKTEYSGRRRPTTRESGYSVHPDVTGGEWTTEAVHSIDLKGGETLIVVCEVPKHPNGSWVGFGGWYRAPRDVAASIDNSGFKTTLTEPASPDWSKFGTMLRGQGAAFRSTLRLVASRNSTVNFWQVSSGLVEPPGCHTHGAFVPCERPSYLEDMHRLAPEALFGTVEGNVGFFIDGENVATMFHAKGDPITLKSCNRCGRYLPINVHDERNTLSFSNHCIARRPCKHGSFGRLTHLTTGAQKRLEYGFQLECRFCKKYCVNAAHNPQRTGAQMKEDGARRRYFEFLIAELSQQSAQLSFKHRTGRELADYIWERFGKRCFGCNAKLPSVNDMHLDHTRPLALLWPLDETATALCASCNSAKSDLHPNEFYKDPAKLRALSKITEIPLDQLQNPSPNMAILTVLLQRLDWLFDVFLARPEMTKERDGKVAAELVLRALQKVFARAGKTAVPNLVTEYERRSRPRKS